MKRVIIDTDPGIDDTAAIFLALASPELVVEAVTTVYGNGIIKDCTRNALIILETAGRTDIPVYQGVGQPLMRQPNIAHYIREYYVRISTHDELTKGQTVTDVIHRWEQLPNTRVAMDIKADQLVEMFANRVINYTGPTHGPG